MAVRLDVDGGERIIGVRSNDPEVVAALRARLASHVVDGIPVYANISLKVGARLRGRRDAHLVVRRGYTTYRTFDLDDAIDATVRTVHTLSPPPEGATVLYARALLRGGRATVVIEPFAEAIDSLHRRIAAAGFTPLRHSPVLADVAAGELLVPDEDPFRPTYHRVPIANVVVFAPPNLDDDSEAVRLSYTTCLIAGRERTTRLADLEALVTLTQRVPFTRLDALEPRPVVQAICSL